ncbi:hypothetical protein NHL50_08535 [Acidimicrobiia bacterium EGI L10123]|uniref:hypothetical protein n=1 Tax=Salinilacustrithrix flava TaxID=2957203 RepID=UPI003D7C266D|nr:hypothetical protein [Acidimicrobiia bacterium EGI L10123]
MSRPEFVEAANSYIRERADGALLDALEDPRVLPELKTEIDVIRRRTEIQQSNERQLKFLVGVLDAAAGVDRLIRQAATVETPTIH